MKKYNVIYADPPWNTTAGRTIGGYKMEGDKQLFISSDNNSRKLSYPSMTVDEICQIPVKEIAAKDAHLYMWVTNQYLLQAEKVILAWGFKYSTCLTWSKKVMGGGLGGAFGISSEYLLFCTKGSLKAMTKIKGTVFEVKRPYVNGYPCHSKKPNFFAELIEQVSPGTRLEMFARKERSGWDVFGNQVNNSIEISNYKPQELF